MHSQFSLASITKQLLRSFRGHRPTTTGRLRVLRSGWLRRRPRARSGNRLGVQTVLPSAGRPASVCSRKTIASARSSDLPARPSSGTVAKNCSYVIPMAEVIVLRTSSPPGYDRAGRHDVDAHTLRCQFLGEGLRPVVECGLGRRLDPSTDAPANGTQEPCRFGKRSQYNLIRISALRSRQDYAK
jgi:hypothetical protein